jgi:hypothetical protein
MDLNPEQYGHYQRKTKQNSQQISKFPLYDKNSNQKFMKAVAAADGYFRCPFCTRKFTVCAALGGHISKSHPGKSKTYNHKKEVR